MFYTIPSISDAVITEMSWPYQMSLVHFILKLSSALNLRGCEKSITTISFKNRSAKIFKNLSWKNSVFLDLQDANLL